LKLYLDSNVFISLVREEIDGNLNILFNDAELFLSVCSKKNFTLILSFLFFREIEKSIFLGRKDVIDFIKSNYKVTIKVFNEEKDYSPEVERIIKETGIHLSDALHIAIALDSKADLIISWNKKDFVKAIKLINCLTPKEFIDESP